MKKNKNKDRGFTITELLVVISVLSLIMTIVIYVAISVVDNANEKTYSITVSNIEKIVDDYLLENSDRLFYIDKDANVENLEYQCVTVNDLVETGYFKDDVYEAKVSKDRYVLKDDYVYIEREKDTKSVSKIKYLLDDEYVSMCDKAVKAISDVSIIVSPEDLSTYKDITIKYRVKNYFNINNYTYHYSYSKDDVVSVISDNGNEKKLRVTDNGIIKAWVEDEKGIVLDFGNEKEINKIDKEPPVIKTTDIVRIYTSKFDLCEGLTITDNSGKETVCRSYYNGVEFTDSSKLPLGDNVLYYEAEDLFGNVSERVSRIIKIVVPDKEFNYKEEDQIYQVEADGTYIIESYGAQGGNSGGLGGYVKAEVSLKTGDRLVINTGGVNGYNGGGGYGNGSYYSGGGGTTVRYNNDYIVIAGGGGAKGAEGTAGTGGSGNGTGGANVGSGAGLTGSNGGGGSNSLNYNYNCNCQTCGGGCKRTAQSCDTCHGRYECNCSSYRCCTGTYVRHDAVCRVWGTCSKCSTCTSSYACNCSSYCAEREPTYSCNCQTCTKNGKSGTGGASSVNLPAVSIESSSGKREKNGYVKVSYKLEG